MKGSLTERSPGVWKIGIYLGVDADGKQIRKFETVKGNKSAAQRRLRELLTNKDRGLNTKTKKLTLGTWMDRWLAEYVRPKNSPRTFERYRHITAKHILPVLGHIELTKLSPSDVHALEARLGDQGMAPAGVELVHGVLSGALKAALKLELVWRVVTQAITPPRVERKEVEPPEITLVRRILDIAREEEHPLYAALPLIAYTGIWRVEPRSRKFLNGASAAEAEPGSPEPS